MVNTPHWFRGLPAHWLGRVVRMIELLFDCASSVKRKLGMSQITHRLPPNGTLLCLIFVSSPQGHSFEAILILFRFWSVRRWSIDTLAAAVCRSRPFAWDV